MGKKTELLINVDSIEMRKLLIASVAGHPTACMGCVTLKATGEKTGPNSVV